MPDGSAWRGPSVAESVAPRSQRRATATAAMIAVALHGLAFAPFLVPRSTPPVVAIADAVEVAPLPEAAAPATAEESAVAEAVSAVMPEPPTTAAAPPEPMRAEPPEQLLAQAPDALAAVTPPPADAAIEPPPPEEAAESEPIEATPPMEELAALPPPPPPTPKPRQAPAAPRQPSRAAPAAPPSAPPPAPAASAAPPAPVSRQPPPSYVGALLAALERHKTYPQSARLRRQEGTAVLRFAMRRDGHVVSWRIERSTGHDELDAAVEQMIRGASPLPPPPPELAGDPVEIVVPVRFRLR